MPYAFGAAGGAAGVIAPGPPGMPAGFAATSVAARMEWPLKLRVKLNCIRTEEKGAGAV